MARRWKQSKLKELGATPVEGRNRVKRVANALRDYLSAAQKESRKGMKPVLIFAEDVMEAFGVGEQEAHQALRVVEDSDAPLIRRLTPARLHALGAKPASTGLDKIDHAYTVLHNLLEDGELGEDLRAHPYLITSNDLRQTFDVAKETANRALKALENEQWAYAEGGTETRLLGPLRFAVWISMKNMLGAIGEALKVFEHGSTIPVDISQAEVRKKVLEVEEGRIGTEPTFTPESCSAWLPLTGPRFREQSPVLIVRRAIYVRLYEVMPDVAEWDIPVGVHETVLDATIPMWSPKGTASISERESINRLRAFVDGLGPTDGLREKIREVYELTPDRGLVQTKIEHSSSRDVRLLEQVPHREPLYLSLRQAVWTWRGSYHFRDQGHCWETTREMYLHTVGMRDELTSESPRLYIREGAEQSKPPPKRKSKSQSRRK